MIQPILSNLAIILLLHLVMTGVMEYKGKMTNLSISLFQMSLLTVSVIVILYLPIPYENFYFDMRILPLLFFAYFHGWRVVLLPLLLISLWNYSILDGDLWIDIVCGMVVPTMIALIFSYYFMEKDHVIKKIVLVIVSGFVSTLAILFVEPEGVAVFGEMSLLKVASLLFVSIIWYVFIQQNRQRQLLHQKLERAAAEDALTALFNKRMFFEVVEKQLQMDKPNHFIAMLDIDYFKPINDTYGHLVGDAILQEFANILKQYESPHLKVGRYGGEEFILYISNSTHEQAKVLIEQLFTEIRTHTFQPKDAPRLKITVSLGLSVIEDKIAINEAVSKADTNLYKAKANGRNCFVCF